MAKKIVDKWKSKKWFNVVAPDVFDRRNICEIVAGEDAEIVGRKVKTTLDMITGNYAFPNPYVIVNFQVSEVKGQNCFTKYVSHELAFSYISTLVRRRKCLMDHVTLGVSRDGVNLKVKVLMVAQTKVSRVARKALRHKTDEFLIAKLKDATLDDFLKMVFFGKLNVELFGALKKLAPVVRVEIRKVEVVKAVKKDKEQKQAQ